MKRIVIVIGALAGAAVLLALGYVGGRHAGTTPPRANAAATAQGSPRKVLYWYDTMVPNQHFDHP
ncbi:MAG: efflux transporter periplasmic adaptor subunit, partial [Xanthomonadaceae bacterium]|nr:efflux transporter periplasmic adaptor subunit [Xanthomonadaceae bacterium]